MQVQSLYTLIFPLRILPCHSPSAYRFINRCTGKCSESFWTSYSLQIRWAIGFYFEFIFVGLWAAWIRPWLPPFRRHFSPPSKRSLTTVGHWFGGDSRRTILRKHSGTWIHSQYFGSWGRNRRGTCCEGRLYKAWLARRDPNIVPKWRTPNEKYGDIWRHCSDNRTTAWKVFPSRNRSADENWGWYTTTNDSGPRIIRE